MTGSDTAAVRRAIDAEVRGRTLCDLFSRNAEQHAARIALRWPEGGGWRTWTWYDYVTAVREVGMGLVGLGVAPGDRVALTLGNRPEQLVAGGGALHAAATPVSLDRDLAPERIAQIARDCAAKVAVVEGADGLARWEQVRDALPALEHVVVVDGPTEVTGSLGLGALRDGGRTALERHPGGLHSLMEQLQPDAAATLLYASGDDAAVRGVLVSHRNVLWQLASLERCADLPPEPRTVSHAPPTAFAERLLADLLALQKAGSVAVAPGPADLVEVAQAVRPQVLTATPDTWGALRSQVVGAVEAEPSERRRRLDLTALEAGQEAVRDEQEGRRVPATQRARLSVYERLVYPGLREEIGLGECALAVSVNGAPPPLVSEFFSALGLPVYGAYGLPETTGLSHLNRPGRLRIGTVGEPLPGVEVRLTSESEIVVRGGNVTRGYFGDEVATHEVLDDDAWLHTGDHGSIDADGYLTLVDRPAS